MMLATIFGSAAIFLDGMESAAWAAQDEYVHHEIRNVMQALVLRGAREVVVMDDAGQALLTYVNGLDS